MKIFIIALVASVSLYACQTPSSPACPPFPWPNEKVIDFIDDNLQENRDLEIWWVDIIRHGVECGELSN